MKNKVYLYGFGELHRVEAYSFLKQDDFSVRNITIATDRMLDRKPSICKVYVIDNRYGLCADYMEAVKTNDFVKHYEFEDLVSREGLLVYERSLRKN